MNDTTLIFKENKRGLIFSNTSMGKLATFLIIYASFYYPAGAFCIVNLGVPSTPVNIGFRAIAAITALFLIIVYLLNESNHLKLTKGIWLLLAWWFYYGSRLIIDLVRGVKFGEYENHFVYGIAFGNIFCPMIAIVLWRKYIDLELFNKWVYVIVAVNSFLILTIILKQAQRVDINLFMQRIDLVNNKGKARESSVLNAILVGLYGEMLIILSLIHILFNKIRPSIIIYLSLLVIGILLLLFGASRGPLLACALNIILLLLVRFYISRSKVVISLKYIVFSLFIGVVLSKTLLSDMTYKDFVLFNRIVKFAEDRQSNREDTRLVHIDHAWKDFLDSPIVGKQFVGTLDGYYPHNIVVEVFMASGLIGALLFFPMLLNSIRHIFQYLKSSDINFIQLTFLFLPNFFFLFTSGNLFQSVEFWLLLTMVFIIQDSKK